MEEMITESIVEKYRNIFEEKLNVMSASFYFLSNTKLVKGMIGKLGLTEIFTYINKALKSANLIVKSVVMNIGYMFIGAINYFFGDRTMVERFSALFNQSKDVLKNFTITISQLPLGKVFKGFSTVIKEKLIPASVVALLNSKDILTNIKYLLKSVVHSPKKIYSEIVNQLTLSEKFTLFKNVGFLSKDLVKSTMEISKIIS